MNELRPEPHASRFTPQALDQFVAEARAWYESSEDVRRGLIDGHRKAQLIAWIRRHMETDLAKREVRFIELHYFVGLSQARIARIEGVHASTVCRTIKGAIKRLRAATAEDPSWRFYASDRRRPTTQAPDRTCPPRGYPGNSGSPRTGRAESPAATRKAR